MGDLMAFRDLAKKAIREVKYHHENKYRYTGMARVKEELDLQEVVSKLLKEAYDAGYEDGRSLGQPE